MHEGKASGVNRRADRVGSPNTSCVASALTTVPLAVAKTSSKPPSSVTWSPGRGLVRAPIVDNGALLIAACGYKQFAAIVDRSADSQAMVKNNIVAAIDSGAARHATGLHVSAPPIDRRTDGDGLTLCIATAADRGTDGGPAIVYNCATATIDHGADGNAVYFEVPPLFDLRAPRPIRR